MTDDLYERYKEALRNGHVAVLRGALKDALAAYRTAAEIAPSRAMPHTSMGGVFMRMGHLEDALTEFGEAVARAPHDEGALLGQAEALVAAGMRSDAAQVLDHVAEIQESAARLPEAADTLRRALELEENPDRVRRQRALLRQIRFSAGDRAAEQLLARALRLRDEPADGLRLAVPDAALDRAAEANTAPILDSVEQEAPRPAPEVAWPPEPVPEPLAEATPPPLAQPEMAAAAQQSPEAAQMADLEAEFAEREPEPIESVVAEAMPDRLPAEPEPVLSPVPGAVPLIHPQPEPVVSQPSEEASSADRIPVGVMASMEEILGPIGPSPITGNRQPSGDELLSAAEAADLAGDARSLRSLLLWTARAYAREGRFEAGLDAAHRLLQRAPNDVDAHLVLVELYLARRWDGLAADKLRLLGKLAELNDDRETRRRLSVVATKVFPEDPTLAGLLS